jgi:hypothetical protein
MLLVSWIGFDLAGEANPLLRISFHMSLSSFREIHFMLIPDYMSRCPRLYSMIPIHFISLHRLFLDLGAFNETALPLPVTSQDRATAFCLMWIGVGWL